MSADVIEFKLDDDENVFTNMLCSLLEDAYSTYCLQDYNNELDTILSLIFNHSLHSLIKMRYKDFVETFITDKMFNSKVGINIIFLTSEVIIKILQEVNNKKTLMLRHKLTYLDRVDIELILRNSIAEAIMDFIRIIIKRQMSELNIDGEIREILTKIHSTFLDDYKQINDLVDVYVEDLDPNIKEKICVGIQNLLEFSRVNNENLSLVDYRISDNDILIPSNNRRSGSYVELRSSCNKIFYISTSVRRLNYGG